MDLNTYAQLLEKLKAHCRENNIGEGEAANAAILAAGLERSLWHREHRAEAARLAQEFRKIQEAWATVSS